MNERERERERGERERRERERERERENGCERDADSTEVYLCGKRGVLDMVIGARPCALYIWPSLFLSSL